NPVGRARHGAGRGPDRLASRAPQADRHHAMDEPVSGARRRHRHAAHQRSALHDDQAERDLHHRRRGDAEAGMDESLSAADCKQAASALAEIDDIVQRVRQSRIYDLASQVMIMWGVLVFVADIATWLWPREAYYYWLAVYVLGIAGSFAISSANRTATGFRG